MNKPTAEEALPTAITPEAFAALMERYLKDHCRLCVSVDVSGGEDGYGYGGPRVTVNVSLVTGKDTILLEGEDSAGL